MNTIDKDRLYKLLPYIYQLRDYEQGEPLRALLQVIAEQVEIVEEDVNQLYENCFIETCEDWVVPYIGDLIGYTPVHEAGEPGEITTPQGKLRNKILIPRREIANTIRYRRRKGSLALLEQLVNDVAGWPARAVEFYKLLGWTQHVNHLRLLQGKTVDLRMGEALEKLAGPFDELAHTVDVRRINSHLTQGRYNIPSVGLFVWRLKTYSVTKTPVTALEQRHCYTFSVLGNNAPLFTHWEREDEPTQIAEEHNLPVPIRRQAFTESVLLDGVEKLRASAAFYGENKSLLIWAPGWPTKDALQPIPREQIVPADLSDWDRYRPVKDTVAVDPALGRILFPPRQHPKQGVNVSYYYGFSADLGGGEYARKLTQPLEHKIYQVNSNARDNDDQKFKTIQKALDKWKTEGLPSAIIEITDSGLYEEPLKIELKENQSLQVRAANYNRPVIRLSDRPDQFSVTSEAKEYDLRIMSVAQIDGLANKGCHLVIVALVGTDLYIRIFDASGKKVIDKAEKELVRGEALTALKKRLSSVPDESGLSNEEKQKIIRDATLIAGFIQAKSYFTLDGLLIAGRGLQVEGPIAGVIIRHSTLVPGWSLHPDCEPSQLEEPSIDITNAHPCITIEHSIIGSIQVNIDEVGLDPISIRISDSILDATGSDCEGPACEAIGASGSSIAHAVLTIVRSTVFGRIDTHAIELAENSIFMGTVRVARRQLGCMRFCYVRPVSRTPKRYNCQPDLAEQAAEGQLIKADKDNIPPISTSKEAIDTVKLLAQERVRPQFNSARYGTPTYCQLAESCAEEIGRGADDESEMGVFHDLFQPQREANLRTRLEEYIPARADVGIILAS